jgi:hypothetical protein
MNEMPLDTSVLANRVRGMAAAVARGAIGPDDSEWFARSLEMRADEIDIITAERDAARVRSEYWKGEHRAANQVIDTLAADRDRLVACVERVESLVNDHGWSRGLGADDVVTISTPDSLALTHALTDLLDYAQERRAALEGSIR